MAEPKDIFTTKVVPIMNRVRADLQAKQAEELRGHTFSLSGLLAGAAGPDGGMTAMAAHQDSLRYTGKWNSKTVEDYVEMVKAELERQHITVTPELETQMIAKMVKEQIPKSSLDYIIRKTASHTLFGLPNELHKSPLQAEIEARAEAAYQPSKTEKAVAWGLGTGVDCLSLGGFGGGWKSAAAFFGSDIVLNTMLGKKEPAVVQTETTTEEKVPLVIAPEYRGKYLEEMKQREQREEMKSEKKGNLPIQPQAIATAQPTEVPVEQEEPYDVQEQTTTVSTYANGWNGLMQSFGLNGFSDIGKNMGYVLAMLPDVLVGLFTGKTKSLNADNTVLPLASILAGMFIKNPVLKMLLIGVGGANLINKAGHEALEQKRNERIEGTPRYKTYADEPLNPRILNPILQGNSLIAHIDHVPCTIQLPDSVVGAYQTGALPLSTLANAVLAKSDEIRRMTSEQYEENRQETITRTRGIQ